MRKIIKNNLIDEDYLPFGDSVSLKEFNKNIQEFNNDHYRISMIAKIKWFIRKLFIMMCHILIAIFCCDYLYDIIKP